LDDGIHDDWNKNRRPKSFQEHICDGLGERVRDKEYRQRRVILAGGHVIQTSLQADDFGIANICPVQESQEVQDAKL
jgi:hypothetical protein